MTALLRAEFAKLFATRLWLGLLLATMALTALFASLNIAFNGDPQTLAPPLATAPGQKLLFATSAGAAQPLVAVLAAIGIAGEYRHRTAATTYLITPHRIRVLVAKLVTYSLAGAAYAIACLATVAAIGWPWLRGRGIELTLAPSTVVGVMLAVVLFALLGVGLGAWLREQVAVVVGLLIYLFVAEPIVTQVPALREWTRFLPGPAASALTQISLSNQDFLRPWQGGMVLVGYAVLVTAIGLRIAARHDLT